MIDRYRYKRYVKNAADGIVYYIKNIRLYRGNTEKTTRYQWYIRRNIKDLIRYLNKF